MLTRREAAEILGISQTALRYLEEVKGLLRSEPTTTQIRRGSWIVQHLYDEKAVRELAKTYRPQKAGPPRKQRGTVASKAFALFKAGKSWREVVIACEVTPLEACELLRQYELDANYLLREAADQRMAEVAVREDSAERSRAHQKEMAAIRARKRTIVIERAETVTGEIARICIPSQAEAKALPEKSDEPEREAAE